MYNIKFKQQIKEKQQIDIYNIVKDVYESNPTLSVTDVCKLVGTTQHILRYIRNKHNLPTFGNPKRDESDNNKYKINLPTSNKVNNNTNNNNNILTKNKDLDNN
ncbi:unnamed protein product, partial [marine sediment metagenome]